MGSGGSRNIIWSQMKYCVMYMKGPEYSMCAWSDTVDFVTSSPPSLASSLTSVVIGGVSFERERERGKGRRGEGAAEPTDFCRLRDGRLDHAGTSGPCGRCAVGHGCGA